MRILYKVITFFWGVVIVGVAVNQLSEHLEDFIKHPFVLFITIFILTLFAAFSWKIYKKNRKEQLIQEFSLFSKASELKPEQFGFKVMQPGEVVSGNNRPYYQMYIPREAIAYDDANASGATHDEAGLAKLLEQGSNILIIGRPTDGKTRTLYEVIHQLPNFWVISLRVSMNLSDEALALLSNKKIVCVFDDLNTYDSSEKDFSDRLAELKKFAKHLVLVATCRDGPQLMDVQLNTGSLQKIYELFDQKLKLKPVQLEQKKQLRYFIGVTENREYPTLGAVCMHQHFGLMRERYQPMDGLVKDCLRSLILLYEGLIYPFTRQRIQAILIDMFKRDVDEAEVRDSLNILSRNGFIISPEDVDPVIVEAAYVTEPENQFYYSLNHLPKDDLRQLATCLLKRSDLEGLSGLAQSRYYANDLDFAISLWEQVINKGQNDLDPSIQQIVATALYNKGVTLGQLNRSDEAIACYDELVQRFSDSQELALQEWVAKALNNKGFTLGQLNRPDEEIACYDEVLQRFGNSQELVLQERVAKDLYNKGVTLEQLNRPDEEIACYDEVLQRFGDSQELALQERLAKALNNKGATLGQLNRPDEEIACYDEVLQRFGDSQELALQKQLAKALYNKGVTLGQLNRPDEAITCCNELVQRFDNSEDLVLKELVANTINFRDDIKQINNN